MGIFTNDCLTVTLWYSHAPGVRRVKFMPWVSAVLIKINGFWQFNIKLTTPLPQLCHLEIVFYWSSIIIHDKIRTKSLSMSMSKSNSAKLCSMSRVFHLFVYGGFLITLSDSLLMRMLQLSDIVVILFLRPKK